jgi:hypothetical protein
MIAEHVGDGEQDVAGKSAENLYDGRQSKIKNTAFVGFYTHHSVKCT